MPAETLERSLPWETDVTSDETFATAAEMIEAAGLNWDVEVEPIALASDSSIISPDRFATVRSTDKAWLGTVGRQYQPIFNRDAFGFGDALVDSDQAKWRRAAMLRGGKVVFAVAELSHLGLDLSGISTEAIRTWLLISNAHDGSRALEADIIKTRDFCKNALNVTIRGALRRFKIRHSGSTDGKLLAAREALGIAFRYDEAFNAAAETLLRKDLAIDQVREILRTAVWPIDEAEASEARLESHPSTLALENLLSSETIPDGIRGTAWGAFNAVTEIIDHKTEYRKRHDTVEDVKFNSVIWGTGQAKKQATFDALLKVASAKR